MDGTAKEGGRGEGDALIPKTAFLEVLEDIHKRSDKGGVEASRQDFPRDGSRVEREVADPWVIESATHVILEVISCCNHPDKNQRRNA